jgi:glycosyltransferase involved in cell wall biosynthesis
VGDPFAQLRPPANNPVLYRRLNVQAERRVMKAADRVVVTNHGAADLYLRAFPETNAKLHIIPPLNSMPQVTYDFPSILPANGKIKLLFVGTLYKSIRGPSFLLRLFQELCRNRFAEQAELHLIGDLKDCAADFTGQTLRCGGGIFLHGVQSRQTVARAMSEAHVLVNIGNTTDYQLPSKVVEYAATGKPVLNLVTSGSDTSLAFYRDYPAALSLRSDEELSPAKLAAATDFICAARQRPAKDAERWRDNYSVSRIASAYEELIH